MTDRRYTYWGTISTASIQGGVSFINGEYESKRANDIVYSYANSRHNILGATFGGAGSRSEDSIDYVVKPIPAGFADEENGYTGVNAFVRIPIQGRVVYPGNLRVWIRCKTASEVAANAVYITASAPYSASKMTSVCSTNTAWYSLDLTLDECNSTYPEVYSENRTQNNLYLFARGGGLTSNNLYVYCVCAYQRQVSATPEHVSLSAVGNLIGEDDKPMSAAVAKLLQDETNMYRNSRLPRSNVISHWFSTNKETSPAAYAANADALGQYKLVKRAGCSALFVRMCVNDLVSSSSGTIQATLTSAIDTTMEIAGIATNSCSYWVTPAAFTFTTANTAAEKELTLSLTSKKNSGSPVLIVHGVCVTEKPPSATSVAHTIPEPPQFSCGKYISSVNVENCRSTLSSLWLRQPAIAMSDWRACYTGEPNSIRCTTTTYGKDHPTKGSADHTSLIARALVWPSYGCSRIRVTLGFETYSNITTPEDASTILKHIYFQLSDSTVNATNQWAGPAYYLDSGGSYTQTEVVGYYSLVGNRPVGAWQGSQTWQEYYAGTYQARGWGVRGETSPVTAVRWLSPTSTITAASLANPYQVWVFSYTDDVADYVAPTYVTIEEIPLTETEFP